MEKVKAHNEFELVAKLIDEARNRAYSKVNAELVLLYFKIGNIVFDKVVDGAWGENTVGALADYLQRNYSGYGGFTRRGLYRMKQFYEVYSSNDFVLPLVTQLEAFFSDSTLSSIVSALPSQSKNSKNEGENVSALPTRLENIKSQLITLLLCKVTWTNHMEILSQTKSAEEKFFYLLHCIKEKWSMRDLRRGGE